MILYVSKRFETNIASQVHYKVLEDKFGVNNIYTVDLRLFDAKQKKNYIAYGKYKSKLKRIQQWLKGNTMYISNAIIDDICRIIYQNKIELVFIEDSVFGSLVKRIKKQFPYIKVISFYHDMGADLFVQWARRENWMGKIECKLSIHQEKLNQKYCDVNIVFNKRDASLYQKYYGKRPDAIIPISTPIPNLNQNKEWDKEKLDFVQILFVGSKYYPNIVGIRWFYNNVLPKLNKNIKLNIVGRGTEILKDEFTDSRVKIYGSVDSLAPYYLGADIVIAPLFDGGGMKTKTVEALSYGNCVVATDEGLEGFWEEMDKSIQNKIIFKSNNIKEWINELNELSVEKPKKFNEEIFELFKRRFSYEATRKELWNLLDIENK